MDHPDERPWNVTYTSPVQVSKTPRVMVVLALNRSHAYEVFKERCPYGDIVEVN